MSQHQSQSETKLFEILAVEAGHQGVMKKLYLETEASFGKENQYTGKSRQYVHFDTSTENSVEVAAIVAKESDSRPVSMTVPEVMNYFAKLHADYLDVSYQKEATNAIAEADIVLPNGTVLKENVPVTMLLSLEGKLVTFRALLDKIPTLPPGRFWEKDPSASSPYIFRDRPVSTLKVVKHQDYRIVAPATERHPAQVIPQEIQKNVGQYIDVSYSGMVSPADKAMIITRCDTLLKAVKQARQRANAQRIDPDTIGNQIMGYILGTWFDPDKFNPNATV